MTSSTAEDEPEFGASRVIASGFRVLGSNLLAFLFISLLLIAPVYLFLAWVSWGGEFILTLVPLSVFEYGILLVEMLLSFVAQAAVVYGTIRYLQGRRAGFAATVTSGLRKVVPVVFVAVVVGFATALGMFIFLIPGLMIMTAYWVAVPAAVIEDKGIWESLHRSADLTRDCRWKVFGVILVALAAQVVSENVIELALGFDENYYLSLGLSWFSSSAITALGAVLSTVTYHELRVVKEGADVDQIAAVFD